MGTCGESDLAWQLADAISPVLADDDRAHLYAAIGAGESYDAVDTALETIARDRIPLSPELIAKLLAWVDAYVHSTDAARLRHLLRTITAFS